MKRWAVIASLAGVVSVAVAAALAASRVAPPAETSQGEFTGTWFRVEPMNQQAVQIRRSPDGHRWEIRFLWRTGEDFELDTEWAPRHPYVFKGFPGFVVLDVDHAKSTPNRLVIDYRREQNGPDGAHLAEQGELLVYRTHDGGTLVWLHDVLRTRVTIPEPIAPYEEDGANTETQRLWQFTKVTRRLIPWDEIPW